MASEPESTEAPPLVDALVELSFAIQDVLSRSAAGHDLSVTQLRLLGMLRDRNPPMTAIARHLGLDRSSVTGLIDRAEQRGLVSRTTSSEDARVTIVTATATAFELSRDLEETITSGVEALVAHLPVAERDGLARLATAVLRPPTDAGTSPLPRGLPGQSTQSLSV
jgi:MarR family transcriptional regulator, lower aerobic nicotinate degradation pathway regulator